MMGITMANISSLPTTLSPIPTATPETSRDLQVISTNRQPVLEFEVPLIKSNSTSSHRAKHYDDNQQKLHQIDSIGNMEEWTNLRSEEKESVNAKKQEVVNSKIGEEIMELVSVTTEEGGNHSLKREEAWQLYLTKLDEEANYFRVTEEETDKDLCICASCVVFE